MSQHEVVTSINHQLKVREPVSGQLIYILTPPHSGFSMESCSEPLENPAFYSIKLPDPEITG